jgi:N-sulfoglucosamine sulfohydrolase
MFAPGMTRISFIIVLSHQLFLASVAAQEVKKMRPNIILIVSDDHGREAVGCYGNKAVKTPNIDRLATEGTRFTNAFCTVASCSPSRSVLLTGMQSHTNGMYGLEHQQHHFSSFDTIKSLPVLLQKAGYRTARIGKFHVAPESVYRFEKVLQETGVNNPASLARNPVAMADLCKPFISDTSGQPFFLYFATDDPHRSNSLLSDGTPFFDGSKPNPFGNKPEGYPQVEKIVFKPEEVVVPSFLPDNRAVREELAGYYQAISRLDQGVGRLLEHLKASGKYDNTIIIYLSDNGSPFPGSKTNLYEPGMKLPCIVKLPMPAKPNFVQNAMISWVDIAPTLLDFANSLSGNEQMQGRSMKQIIEQENVTSWDEVYASHNFHEIMMYYPMRVVRERKYKLIYNIAWKLPFPQSLDLHQSYTWQNILHNNQHYPGRLSIKTYLYRPQFELYDLQHDPDELHNLATDPKFTRELNRMKEKLKRFQQNTRDMWLSKWEFE